MNLQLWLAVCLPILAVLASMVLNLLQIFGIRDEVKQIRLEMRDMRGEMGGLRGEMGDLRGEMRDLRAEMRADAKDLRNEVNTKIDLLTSKVYELMNR